MKQLSTGAPSTLGEYKKLTALAFGQDSKAVAFIDKKIKESPKGELEEVLADETQMIQALYSIHKGAEHA